MHILILQETDWISRGPHPQHHIFERLSKNNKICINVLDYDIDKNIKSDSVFIHKRKFYSNDKTTPNSKILLTRTAHLQIPYFRRISSLLSNFFEILQISRKKRPNVIVALSISNGFLGLVISKLLKIPFIFYSLDIIHNLIPIPYLRPIMKCILISILNNTDKIIVTSKLQKYYFINQGIKPEKIIAFSHGFSLENTKINKKNLLNLKNELQITEKDFVIFFMGFLYDFAGLEEIIDFYNQEVKEGKLFLKFIILGDGGIYSDLKRKIKNLDATWVKLVGRVPFFNITEYIQLADLCLLSFSLNDMTREITPIKLIEYMAMKKPVLSTMLPNLVYEFGSDSGAIFVKDQQKLIKEIRHFIPKKDELKEIGEKSYEFVKDQYSWEKIISRFKKIMIEEIKKKVKLIN